MAKAKQLFTAPWYPWYVADVQTSENVRYMSLAEEGAYRRALDNAWREGSIPADPKLLAKSIGKGCSVKVAEVVQGMFVEHPKDASRMVNKKLEKIRKEQQRKHEINKHKGLKGATKRWKQTASVDSPAIPQAMPKQWHSESESESDLDLKRLIDACVREHPDKDARLIEIAVLETMIRRKGSANEDKPIKSAKYFKDEIEHLCSKPRGSASMIDSVLERRRKQVNGKGSEVK